MNAPMPPASNGFVIPEPAPIFGTCPHCGAPVYQDRRPVTVHNKGPQSGKIPTIGEVVAQPGPTMPVGRARYLCDCHVFVRRNLEAQAIIAECQVEECRALALDLINGTDGKVVADTAGDG